MLSFKRCATAVALTMAAVPALAQDMPMPETVIVNVEGTDTFYRVPLDYAANLCEVTDETLAMLAMDANVIYCTIAPTLVTEDFNDFEEVESDAVAQPDLDFDDDGIIDVEDDDIDGDGVANGDDDDADGDDILDTEDDDVNGVRENEDEGAVDGEAEGEVDGEVEGEVDGEVEGDVDVEVEGDASTGG